MSQKVLWKIADLGRILLATQRRNQLHNRHPPSAAKATHLQRIELMTSQSSLRNEPQRQWTTHEKLRAYSINAGARLNTALLMKWLTLIKRNSFVMSIISLFGILDVIFKVSDTVHGTMTLISFVN